MRVLLVIAVLIALGHAFPNFEEVRHEWAAFKAEHQKFYHGAAEDLKRLKIYLENKEKILKHNKLYEQGLSTFFLGLNKFADLLPHERFTGLPPLNRTKFETEGLPYSSLPTPRMPSRPDVIDYNYNGAVTRIKNQGQCGSCWSFAAAGALESRNFRKTGQLLELSEQNLLDCTRPYGNNGCNGGWPHDAFRYVIDNRGIDNEWSYPYQATEGNCRFNQYNVGATTKSYSFIQAGNENQMADALVNEGPIAVAFDAGHDSIMFYKGGVINEPACSTQSLSHAVLLVGYGHDPQGGDYWMLKNSWGASYGEGGFFRMARNRNNMCGISTVASLPLD